jgi:hypothetical protein
MHDIFSPKADIEAGLLALNFPPPGLTGQIFNKMTNLELS